jgi:prevent-host-death family protein
MFRAQSSPSCIAKFGQNGQKCEKLEAMSQMQTLSAKDAKYGFGRLIDLARAEPVAVAKHGRPVVVVMAIEEYERLKGIELSHLDGDPSTNGIAE